MLSSSSSSLFIWVTAHVTFGACILYIILFLVFSRRVFSACRQKWTRGPFVIHVCGVHIRLIWLCTTIIRKYGNTDGTLNTDSAATFLLVVVLCFSFVFILKKKNWKNDNVLPEGWANSPSPLPSFERLFTTSVGFPKRAWLDLRPTVSRRFQHSRTYNECRTEESRHRGAYREIIFFFIFPSDSDGKTNTNIARVKWLCRPTIFVFLREIHN